MQIVIAGATGLIGSALVQLLGAMGHDVHRLVRGPRAESSDIPWDPAARIVATSALEGMDGAVCLSGAGIADHRWTTTRKDELRRSRIQTISFLSERLAQAKDRPECLVCASAIGYYGADRGDEVLTEDSPPGDDFLARLCIDWEDASGPARAAGIRAVHARFGLVLSQHGGMLKKTLLPFRAGLGASLGNGRQYMSWIAISDAIGIIDYALQTDAVEGAINAVAPNPVTNAEFTRALGRAVHRPTILRAPRFVLDFALGEMATAVLGSVRAYPRRLEGLGYQFRYPKIQDALRAALAA